MDNTPSQSPPSVSPPARPASIALIASMGTSVFAHALIAGAVIVAAVSAVGAPAPIDSQIHIPPVTLQTAYVPQALLNAVEPPQPEPEPEPEPERIAEREPEPATEQAAPQPEQPAQAAAAPLNDTPPDAAPADPVRLTDPPEAEATAALPMDAEPVVAANDSAAPVVPSVEPSATASLTPPGPNRQAGATGDGTGTAATPVGADGPSDSDGLSDADRDRLMRRWRSSLDRCLSRAARYPVDRDIRRQRLEGNVYVSIQFNADGSFEQVDVARSSGHDALDSWALQQVRDIGRCAEPPSELGADATRVNVPLQYRMG